MPDYLLDAWFEVRAAAEAASILSAIAAAFIVATLALIIRLRSLGAYLETAEAALAKEREAHAEARARGEAATGAEQALTAERARREALERDLAVAETRLDERERAVVEMRRRLEDEFQGFASRLLDQSQKSFLQRADETFKRYDEAAKGDANERREAVDKMVKPIAETLQRYEQGLAEMRATQAKREGELTTRISELALGAAAVRDEAQKLTTALRSGPKTRGRWGEEALQNVIELSGLSQYVDYDTQKTADDGRLRPDVVVKLPGGRVLALDSKVALDAYLDSLDAETDEARAALLAKHAAAFRTHVNALASKDYAKALRQSLDFVVMFVPGENFFAAACEARPDLFQEAFDKRVLIATPTTLVAILKSVAFGWRREKATENAYKIADMAKELYDSLRKMGLNLSALGRSLEGSVKKYNDLVGGVEARVMPRARRFAELELPGTEEAVEELGPIDQDVREVRDGRDLITGPTDDVEADGGEADEAA
ncbi:MAG: DNA recombination protein RmuC [Pseudomonadota bacterium]